MCCCYPFQLRDGFVEYSYKDNSLILDSVRVNDGQWHYIEARWYQSKMELWLDYGQRQVRLYSKRVLDTGNSKCMTVDRESGAEAVFGFLISA